MIQNNLIYQIYSKALLDKIEKVKKDLKEYKSLRDVCKRSILLNKDFINDSLNVKTDVILTYSTDKEMNSIKYPIYSNNPSLLKAVKLYITNYIDYNKLYNFNLEELNTLKSQVISYSIFNNIIKKFNTKISDKIIYENYKFSMNETFGYISVIKTENHRKRVNWNKSLKNKKEILDRGGIPYKKEDAKNNPNYKGEFWLEYHPAIDFFFHWTRPKFLKSYAYLLRQYTYKPARQGSSNCKAITTKLREVTNNRDLAFQLYK